MVLKTLAMALSLLVPVQMAAIRMVHADDLDALDHNVQAGSSQFTDLQAKIEFHDPFSIALQEVCGGQGIKNYLEEEKYALHLYTTDGDISSCGVNNHMYQIAAGYGAKMQVASGAFPTSIQSSGDISGGRIRGYACVRVAFFTAGWWTCSTHLSSSPSSAQAQAANFAASLQNAPFAGHPRIIGGDFNITRPALESISGNPWYVRYLEGDEAADHPTHISSDHGARKIDYIFAHDTYFNPVLSVGLIYDTSESDHHIYWANFNWG